MNNLTTAKSRIRNAGIAGSVIVLVTLLQMLFPFAGFSPASLLSAVIHAQQEAGKIFLSLNFPISWILHYINILLVLGLTIGTFKKNSLAVTLLFSYGFLALILSIPVFLSFLGIPILIWAAILVFLFLGMVGAFDYHLLLHNKSGMGSKQTKGG